MKSPKLSGIKGACVTFANGKTLVNGCHGVCISEAVSLGWYDSIDTAFEAMTFEGFVTHSGEMLNREDAFKRAEQLRAFDVAEYRRITEEETRLCGRSGGDWLESVNYEEAGGVLAP